MYIKVEEIVNDVIIEEGKNSENDFLRYFKLATNGLKELHFDVGGNIRTVELIVDPSTLTVDLPNDYVNYTKIAIYGSDGDLHNLGLRNEKSLIKSSSTSIVSDDELNPTFYEYTQEYGVGGGNNANGYYRVDPENGTIQFTSSLSGDKIILEYISSSPIHTKNNAVVVHEFCSEALRSYIHWKSIQRKRNIPPAEKESYKREYYNQKRVARARMLSFNKQEALQTTRKPFKQSPKI
tara:strand:- start:1643 stop:2353 length:711 start_codon:yes stop_codon:yes gene_type:complete